MQTAEVCQALGMDRLELERLTASGALAPSGGGARGRRRDWHEADLGLLAVCRELRPAGASPEVLQRVVRYLHGVQHVPWGVLLVVGAHYGPRLVGRDRLGDVVAGAGEPCLVFDLARARRFLNRRTATRP